MISVCFASGGGFTPYDIYIYDYIFAQPWFDPNQILRVSCGFKVLLNLHLNVLPIQSIYPEFMGSWGQLWVANSVPLTLVISDEVSKKTFQDWQINRDDG